MGRGRICTWARSFNVSMPKWVPHIPISTLCSKRLQPSDCIDISGQLRPRLMLPCGSTYLFYPNTTLATDVFPPNTRGFLYYHTPPKASPLVGGLHFRCASNLDDFHKGKDLVLKDNFTPWSIPLYSLANHVTYAKWCEQLMLDHLVTQAALDKWIAAKTVVGDALKRRVGRDRPVLYYLTQPFILHFNTHKISFFTATKDEIGGCLVHNPLKDPYPRNFLPYGGEPSSWIRLYMRS